MSDRPEMVKYEHTDDYGHALTMRPSFDLPDTACVRTSQAVFVKAEDLPGLVSNLYRAAGQEPPIILDRPSAEDLHAQGWIDRKQVNTAANRVIGSVAPNMARGLAACLAAAADLADVEPDPEQVRHLAEVIRSLAEQDVLTGDDGGEAVARAVLAAGYVRKEGES